MREYWIIYLFLISLYGDPWTFDEFMETEKQKKQYHNRPVVKCRQPIMNPYRPNKTGKSTKHPRRNAGWKGSR